MLLYVYRGMGGEIFNFYEYFLIYTDYRDTVWWDLL